MSLILRFSTKSKKESEGKKRWAKAVQKIAIQHQQESALAYIGEDRLQKLTCPSVCVTTHDVDKVSNLIFFDAVTATMVSVVRIGKLVNLD